MVYKYFLRKPLADAETEIIDGILVFPTQYLIVDFPVLKKSRYVEETKSHAPSIDAKADAKVVLV